ncbi:MAG: DUF1667 domain-containing protein [Promethearchaeota archaeon]
MVRKIINSTSSSDQDEKLFTCIICPKGCNIKVKRGPDGNLLIEGHSCERGKKYAAEEFIEPKRILTTTVRIRNAKIPLIPVRTSKPVPKARLNDILDLIATVEVDAPKKCGDIIIKNVLNLGADVIATRSLSVDTCEKIACKWNN